MRYINRFIIILKLDLVEDRRKWGVKIAGRPFIDIASEKRVLTSMSLFPLSEYSSANNVKSIAIGSIAPQIDETKITYGL